jgi:AraC-like DNA-binding protein
LASILPDRARQRVRIADLPEPPQCPYNNVYPDTKHPDGLNASTCPACVARNQWVRARRRVLMDAGQPIPVSLSNRGSRRNPALRRPVPKCRVEHPTPADRASCRACRRRKSYTSALATDARREGNSLVGMVSADAASRHLTELLIPSGLDQKSIAQRAGVSRDTVSRIISGTEEKILAITEASILSVKPLPYRRHGPGGTINATGTRRILRGLYAQGWTATYMAELAGTSLANMWRWIAGTGHHRPCVFVQPEIAETARRLADKLGPFDIADLTEPMDGMSRQCAPRAAKRGWNTLSDWDGLDIDDPRVTPHSPDPLDASNGLVLVDDDRVKQALGFLPTEAADGTLSVERFGRPLTMMEVCEVIRIGSERDHAGEPRFSANLLAQRLGIAERTVQRRRAMMTRADRLLGGPSPRAAAAEVAAVILSVDGWPAHLRLKVAADLLRIDPLQPARTARHLLILGATQPSPIGRGWSDAQLADWLGCEEKDAATLRGNAVLAARQYLEFPAEGETGPPRRHGTEFPAAA